jgi:hypothetical protein
MENQPIPQRELARIGHDSISVFDDRITGDAPLFMTEMSATMLTNRLPISLIAAAPIGRRIEKHETSAAVNQFKSGYTAEWNCP